MVFKKVFLTQPRISKENLEEANFNVKQENIFHIFIKALQEVFTSEKITKKHP